MTTKQLAILLGAAAVLGGAALCLSSGSKPSGAKLNGKAIFPKLDISQVARVELGDKLKLASGEKGWTVETYHNYPAGDVPQLSGRPREAHREPPEAH